MDKPRLARDIINEILLEVSPEKYDLLRKIVEIEDIHLSDRGVTAISQVTAEIERVAKTEVVGES